MKKEKVMFERFVNIICNYVEVAAEDVKMESRFIEDLGFTSFDFMTMLGDLEDEFDIEIDQKTVANVRTVEEALNYMKELGAE